jgi:hypothetical protein
MDDRKCSQAIVAVAAKAADSEPPWALQSLCKGRWQVWT